MLTSEISLYQSKESKDCKVINYEYYFQMVRMGVNKDAVLTAREVYDKCRDLDEDSEEYKAIYKKYTFLKSQSMIITAHGTIPSGEQKLNKNVSLSGVVCIDFDEDMSDAQITSLYADKYTFAMHKSFKGDGYCVFIVIKDKNTFDDAYTAIAKYFFDEYGIKADPSGKNRSRLRFVSYDEDLFVNPSPAKFLVKIARKDVMPRAVDYVCSKEDFKFILDQIQDGFIDLCQEDYYRYVRIGMAIASEFGEAGEEYFHYVCSFGSKYNEKDASRDYKGFVSNGKGEVSIGTFYYYAKEANIQVYSDKSKAIIRRVSVAKITGKPTFETISDVIKETDSITLTEADREFVQAVIDSKKDISKLADSGIKDIEILEKFIIENYEPSLDAITQEKTIKSGAVMSDIEYNDIYIDASKKLDITVSKADVTVILNSSSVKKVNAVKEFFDSHKDYNPVGYIDAYIDCVYPNTEFNRWAFKKWCVGAVHNWMSSHFEKTVSPLTLVLTGHKQGTGKSSFFRNIMPPQLAPYFKESKINGTNNDSMYNMATSLMMLDDEFGGKAHKDVKEFKDTADKNTITQRRPYEREPRTFKRRTVLCGTSNEDDILKDVTGNRRILPINVESTNYERMINHDVASMWVEAYRLLESGFDWKIFDGEDIDYLNDNTSNNQSENPMEDIFHKYISFEHNSYFNTKLVLNQGEMLEYINSRVVTKITKYDIRDIFLKNNIKQTAYRVNGVLKKGIEVYVGSNSETPPDHVTF